MFLSRNIRAVVSLYPLNLRETLGWLPQVIERALAVNPDVYIAILTERMRGQLRENLESYNLADELLKTLKLDDKVKKKHVFYGGSRAYVYSDRVFFLFEKIGTGSRIDRS